MSERQAMLMSGLGYVKHWSWHKNSHHVPILNYENENLPVQQLGDVPVAYIINDEIEQSEGSIPSHQTDTVVVNNNFMTSESESSSMELLKPRDWTTEFQQILHEFNNIKWGTPVSEKIMIYQKLDFLFDDFVKMATMYVTVIIHELGVPENMKSLQVTAVGGYVGGLKFVAGGLLFKLANDTHNLFGEQDLRGPEKMAGREFSGLMSYFNCGVEGLNFPLTCLVDYLGYRVICMSYLPINNSTLVYGSNDGAKTVHNSHEAFYELMKKTALKLNLAGHMVGQEMLHSGKMTHSPQLLYSAGDIEGHVGMDGKFYLLDFSRSMPPEPPEDPSRPTFLYNLFRPELVKSWPVPLCPDTFSSLMTEGTHTPFFNEVYEAHKHIHEVLIPNFAKKLDTIKPDQEGFHLITELHQAGINVRSLGEIHKLITSVWRVELFLEILTRVVKENIRKFLKQEVSNVKFPGDAHYKTGVINHLNMLLGKASGRVRYWETFVLPKLKTKFGITDASPDPPELESHTRWKVLLLKRISTTCGLSWAKYFYLTLDAHGNKFFNLKSPISPMALKYFKPVVKRMNVGYLAKAYMLKVQIRNLKNSFMLNRTIVLLQSALGVYTRDKYAMVQLGHLYQMKNDFKLAIEYYDKALVVDPDFEEALRKKEMLTEDLSRENNLLIKC